MKSFAELFDEAGKRLEDEERRLAAMTPAERTAHALKQAQRERDLEDLLKPLRASGL